MSEVLFTVVVPTRDRNDLLALCLQRLAPGGQTFGAAGYEVIVSDDSPTGAARALVDERFGWVTWIAGPRRGPAANRNRGARAARGTFLIFVDDDCVPEAGLLAGYAAALRDDVAVYEGRTTVRVPVTSARQTAPLNMTGGVLWSCNLAMRRVQFEQIGGFDERFPIAHMEDVDFRDRVRAAGLPVIFVPDASVDHPPRRLRWGWGLGRMHRAGVLYMALHPPRRSLGWFLQNQFRARFSQVLRYPKTPDTLTALFSIPFELACIAWHWRSWNAWADSLTRSDR